MLQTNTDYTKLLKLTKTTGWIGLDNFYLKKQISGSIKLFLFFFGVIATSVTAIYIGLTISESLQTAEELGRSASIRGPIASDTAKGIETSTAKKSLEYFLFAYSHAKSWILDKYLVSFIFLGLGILSFLISFIWWIICVILTNKGLKTRLNGWQAFKDWFTTHQVVEQNN